MQNSLRLICFKPHTNQFSTAGENCLARGSAKNKETITCGIQPNFHMF
jgi:hypothetical protein